MMNIFLQGLSFIRGDVGSYPGVMTPGEPVGAVLNGRNYGASGVTGKLMLYSLLMYSMCIFTESFPSPVAAQLLPRRIF